MVSSRIRQTKKYKPKFANSEFLVKYIFCNDFFEIMWDSRVNFVVWNVWLVVNHYYLESVCALSINIQ